MNFYRAVFPEKNFLENIHKKDGFWGTYHLIFTISGQSYDLKNYDLKIDYICHKTVEFQRNLKHFKFV